MNPSFKHSIIALMLTVAAAGSVAAPEAGTAPPPGAAPPTVRSAPTIVANVHGYTLVGTKLERFSALAFEAGKVLEIGDAAGLRSKYAKARVIDGSGKTLLPGLIDAHGHVLDLGLESVQVQLTGTASLQDAEQKIRAYARANPRRAWLVGGGWNHVIWNLGRFPTAQELDSAVADRPAALDRIDGHAKWLNTKALQAAGITKDTPDPTGGRIERDAAGNPSGILVDKAMDLIEAVIPKLSEAERLAALRAAMRHMNSVGLTGVGDAGVGADVIASYRKLADRGRLTVRVYAMIADTGEDFRALSKDGPLLGYAHDRLTVRSVKLFADGALGSRGAALLAPYSDQPEQTGLLFMTNTEMQHKIETALSAGYQVNIHAIGDAANRQVLDAFEAAYRTAGGRPLRNRIEHAQVVAPSDIPRFKQLNLIASMQPTHATSDMNMAEARIGPERLKGAYAWRAFLDQGTVIAGGSDFPVESDNPFFGLHAAVTRTDHADQPPGGWHPEQAMTLLEAFRAFTLAAAYAEHQEQSLGSLEPGKWADFIVVDRDLFKIPPADIWKIRVLETWLAGERVYPQP
ncbi:MAG TPA: amidohydrolase [Steroidobacteraceae bacterium]|nr:amidohydrolase [Steroidobacteraceae bacterium]